MVSVINDGRTVVNGIVGSLGKGARRALDSLPLFLETGSDVMAVELAERVVLLAPLKPEVLSIHSKVGLYSGMQTDELGRAEIPIPSVGFISFNSEGYKVKVYNQGF